MKSVRSVPPFAATQRNYLWMCWPLLERIEVLNVEANSRLGKLVTRNSNTQSLKLTSGSYKRRLSSITSFTRFYQIKHAISYNVRTFPLEHKNNAMFLLEVLLLVALNVSWIRNNCILWIFRDWKQNWLLVTDELTKQYREAENQIKLFFHLRLMAVRR